MKGEREGEIGKGEKWRNRIQFENNYHTSHPVAPDFHISLDITSKSYLQAHIHCTLLYIQYYNIV